MFTTISFCLSVYLSIVTRSSDKGQGEAKVVKVVQAVQLKAQVCTTFSAMGRIKLNAGPETCARFNTTYK